MIRSSGAPRTPTRHPRLAKVVRPVQDVWTELSRVELVDRSLALGAQALLALIPLLMILGLASSGIGAGGLDQVQDVMGVPEEQLQPFLLAEAPRILFPFARRVITDATLDAGFPPLMLDPIDFASLYMQQAAQQQAEASGGQAGDRTGQA